MDLKPSSSPKEKLKVLFVDDDEINVESFSVYFREEYQLFTALCGEEAREIFHREPDIAMVISDQRMPGISGVELLTHIYEFNPETIRIIITGYMDVSDVIDSINKGHIYQYILKPWDIVQLRLILDQAANTWRMSQEITSLGEELLENNKLLEAANKSLLLSEDRLRHLTGALLESQENEQKRISMELHDELNQSLAAVKLQIKLVEDKLINNVERSGIVSELTALRGFLNEIIENVRRLSKDLSPVIIDDLGLDAAVEHLVSSFVKYHEVDCVMEQVHLAHLFDDNSQRIIYRLVQETLNNIDRHAEATKIEMRIREKENSVSISMIDNGKGFDVKQTLSLPATSRGIGLSAMEERVNMLGGELDIVSTPGKGTIIQFSLPFV
ncbi:MAG: response regulator [Desulfobulbaceae bacterium]|nr:response regulator [Desulfobulbaceae bacterium]